MHGRKNIKIDIYTFTVLRPKLKTNYKNYVLLYYPLPDFSKFKIIIDINDIARHFKLWYKFER